jgi:hypothetical protein
MTAPLPACQLDSSAATAVSVSGARLRLRALVAIGHSPARIARALGEGISIRTVQRILCGAPTGLPQRQLDRIRDLYEQWWDLAPPARTKGERTAATMARRRAREASWCTGMGLDDDRLDEPGYDPQCSWRPATGTGVASDPDPLRLQRQAS